MNTPVLLIHFNRPELTRRQIEALAPLAPRRVHVLCDGPRESRPEDAARVADVRRQFERLPWDCEIKRIYRERNYGVCANIADGISGFLDEYGEGIILEDDCLPAKSFFRFAGEVLEQYRQDERVFAVSGYNGKERPLDTGASYLFSDYFSCWGWATWHRAWRHYDRELSGFRNRSIWQRIRKRVLPGMRQRFYWDYILGKVDRGVTDSWAYRFQLTMWLHEALAVFPSHNLIRNVGFGEEATNTAGFTGADRAELPLPLVHPERVASSPAMNRWIEDNWHSKSLPVRARWVSRKLRQAIPA